MSYNKQNFEDNQVLTAGQLNHMEDGIEAVSNNIGDISQLSTEEKESLVGAINEVNQKANKEADLSNYQQKTDNSLQTSSKDVIGAINELFQSANNGKQLIADAIGNPLINADSTFSAMSETIIDSKRNSEYVTGTRNALYNAMVEDGYDNANNKMTVDELIDLLDRSNIEIGDVKQIDCGYSHTVILKNDNSVWSCGYNFNGQLGLGTSGSSYNKSTFTQVTTDVKQISCGGSHTFIIKNDGSLWACGYNDKGQLGLGDTTDRTTFTQVTENINNDVKQIACGDHTFILKNDGSLWSCGYNAYGQLGLGDTTNRSTFTQVTTDVKQVVCGYHHTFIIKNDGSLWGCGQNDKGQLGLNSTTNKTAFTQVTENINNDVKQVAGGMKNTFILKNDGSVWACGYGEYGKLGLGNTTTYKTFTQVTTNINNDVKQIACGYTHTIILKNDGSVWCCGRNSDGQLGLNDTTNRTTFIQVAINVNNDVKQIACGQNHTIIIKNDGSLWACGYNDYGQLGLGDNTNRIIFTNNSSVSIPEHDIDRLALYNYLSTKDIEVTKDMDIRFMLYLLVDDNANNMILERKNNLGSILTDEGATVTEEDDIASLIIKVDEEFAKDNNTINSLNTEKTNLTNQVNTLNSNIENTRSTLAGLMQEGGYNITGDEDINSLLDLLIINDISLDNIKQIVCGGLHTFILKNDGSLWAAGFNKYGQLGLNSTVDKTTFTQVTTSISDIKQIACGYYHTFILKNDGSVWACGYNNSGQLGLGNTTNYKTFTQVANINDVKQIACGEYHTILLKNNGSLWSCGLNDSGQLGLNDTTNRTTFTQVANINDVKQIVCGEYHTFIIKNDGSVYSCGKNDKGQLGLGNTTNRSTFTQVATDVKQVVCGSSHTFILKNDGSVYSCGYNYSGQLGLNDTTNRATFTQVTTNINDVKQIACGGSHTFILKNDGSLWAAGNNYNGQLGLGTSDNNVHGTFTQITTNINNDVKQIACGLDIHTIILKNDNSIWGTGRNDKGQLGLSNTSEKTAFTIVPKGFTY